MEGIIWKNKTTNNEHSKFEVVVVDLHGHNVVVYTNRVLTEDPSGYHGYRLIRKFGHKFLIEKSEVIRHESLELLYQSANNIILEKKVTPYDEFKKNKA